MTGMLILNDEERMNFILNLIFGVGIAEVATPGPALAKTVIRSLQRTPPHRAYRVGTRMPTWFRDTRSLCEVDLDSFS